MEHSFQVLVVRDKDGKPIASYDVDHRFEMSIHFPKCDSLTDEEVDEFLKPYSDDLRVKKLRGWKKFKKLTLKGSFLYLLNKRPGRMTVTLETYSVEIKEVVES
jgi:hypothetical protein